MAKARNPKRSQGRSVGQASRLSVVPRPKGSGTTLSHAPAEMGQRRSDASLTQTGETPILRTGSDFGLLSDFGFRPSDFPHAPIPLKTANNQKTAIQQGRAGFTLIEVLVVIAVLTLMAALVLPALSRSKLSARRIKCASNLRQIGIAAQMYRDDNGGYTFRYRGISTNGGDLYWFGWLERGVEGKRTFDPKPGALYPYLGSRGVEMCPSLDYAFREFKLKALGAAYGYGYNLCLSAPLDEPPLNGERVKRPSDCAVFADAAQVNTFQPPASPQNPLLEEFYYVSTNEATAHFRHRQTANVVFCDAHVERERPVAGSLDTRLPSQEVGRLRPEILLVP